jgi:phosphate-selective porin OprO/OprP
LRALEEQNRKLSAQLEQSDREHKEQMGRLLKQWEELSKRYAPAAESNGNGTAAPTDTTPPDDRDTSVPDYTEELFRPYSPGPRYELSGPTRPLTNSLKTNFGPGFQLMTEDEKFLLQFDYESQIEARVWEQDDQLPANSGFFLPRQRFFFSGRITKPVEYEISVNRGVNNINILNAYLNFHFDDRLEVRIGRFFTPMAYEQYAISNYWLLTPERSVFTTNLSLNRQIGAMAWGYLLDKRLDYAAGIFNGSRNSFESLNNGVDFVGYLNARPFRHTQSLPAARFLNVGSSVAYGRQDQNPVPATFRIGAGSPDANIPSIATVPFLIFNPGVSERGERVIGSVHAAYFYKSLSLVGEWQYGYGGYASNIRPQSVRVPFEGFYVTGGYFLTGEHVERRTRLKPLRSLIPTSKDEPAGVGAWEVTGRVSQLRVGGEVFTGGFADPAIWSDRATTTELGVNWYLNEYLKVYAFWLHADFRTPVQYRPGRLQKTADMLWLRCQLYF